VIILALNLDCPRFTKLDYLPVPKLDELQASTRQAGRRRAGGRRAAGGAA